MTRRATIRTTHADAEAVAAAIEPDNTAEMETTMEGETVRTRIERETTGGLHSTVDDYVVNLDVAATVVQQTNDTDDTTTDAGARSNAGAEASTTNDTNNE